MIDAQTAAVDEYAHLGEAHPDARVGPYTYDSAPMAHRVGVREGDL